MMIPGSTWAGGPCPDCEALREEIEELKKDLQNARRLMGEVLQYLREVNAVVESWEVDLPPELAQ